MEPWGHQFPRCREQCGRMMNAVRTVQRPWWGAHKPRGALGSSAMLRCIESDRAPFLLARKGLSRPGTHLAGEERVVLTGHPIPCEEGRSQSQSISRPTILIIFCRVKA